MSAQHGDPRVERTRAHVLGHARELLAGGGPAALTYTALAHRARVTRQTLYRHWPSPDLMLADLVLERAVEEVRAAGEQADPAGTPEHAVTRFLHQLRASMDDPANTGPLMALVAHADHHEASRRAMAEVVVGVRDALNRVLAPTGAQITIDEYHRVAGPVMFRRFFAREPVTDAFIDELVAAWSVQRAARRS